MLENIDWNQLNRVNQKLANMYLIKKKKQGKILKKGKKNILSL